MDAKAKATQIEIIEILAECLNVPACKLQFNDSQMISRTDEETRESTVGFVSIIQQMISESDTEIAKNSCLNQEIVAQVHQWIEFVQFNITTINDFSTLGKVFCDLNCVLATRSYLVDQFCTVADAIVFYAIQNDMVKIIQTNENHHLLNLFRWFDHLQQRTDIQDETKVIKMARCFI